jgi:hypothetical protein
MGRSTRSQAARLDFRGHLREKGSETTYSRLTSLVVLLTTLAELQPYNATQRTSVVP